MTPQSITATLQQPSLTVLFPRQDSGGSHGTITGHVARLATWSAVQRGFGDVPLVAFWTHVRSYSFHHPNTANGSLTGLVVQMAPLGHCSQNSPGAP